MSIKQFLQEVVVWPGSPQDPGWINLHCHFINKNPADTSKANNGGKDWVIGWPYKAIDEFINRAGWIDTTNTMRNVWFCTSQQRDTGVNKKGGLKAKRLAVNATWMKAIWVDIDIKAKPATWDAENPGKPWDHYETEDQVWAALTVFCKTVGLPRPSAMVDSGGGFHIYWISDTPLTVQQWRPYAEGLKASLLSEGVLCDAGLTTDAARILRVPGTKNHKYTPPRSVKLLEFGRLYNFEKAFAFLTTVRAGNVQTAVTEADVVDPSFGNAKPAASLAALAPSNALQAGIAPVGPQLVDPKPIFEQCGFLKEARSTGGVSLKDQPQWNIAVLCTVFMEGGNALAHEISHLSPHYKQPDCQALYDRKLDDRASRGVGYPSCNTIKGLGSAACASCPLLAKGKSPLNIRPAPTVTATVTGFQNPVASTLMLPVSQVNGIRYDVDGDGIICAVEEKTNKKGDTFDVWHQLFHNKIDMPWVQKDPDVIHFRASYDLGNYIHTSVRHEDWCGHDIGRKLAAAKVNYVGTSKKYLEAFMQAWLSYMHNAVVAQTAQGFGWYRENGIVRGFAYGGLIHKDDGTTAQAGLISPVLQKRFEPQGQSAPWYTAADYMFRQKRPELEAIIASSFAAPLLSMTGMMGAILSVWGDSGAGKSYALELGAAVWGDPIATKEVISSTWKNVEKRLGATVNLPVYWDEITNEAAVKNLYNLLMVTTAGVAGGRLKQNTEFADKGTWATLVGVNANVSFKEYVAKQQSTHSAGVNRVLEYHIVKQSTGPGRVAGSEADQALAAVRHNFGSIGLDYATVLGKDHAKIQQRIDDMLKQLERQLRSTEEDRFWVAVMAALIVAAEIAHDHLNVAFDVPALYDFLIQVYQKNKQERTDANINPNTAMYAEDALTAFLKKHTMNTIFTEGAPAGAGRYHKVPWRKQFPNAPLPVGVVVRHDTKHDTTTLSEREFKAWCTDPNGGKFPSANEIIRSLQNKYIVKRERRVMTAGTDLTGGNQEWVLVIDATGVPELLDNIHAQGVDNSALGASTGMSASVVDTGVLPDEEEIMKGAQRG